MAGKLRKKGVLGLNKLQGGKSGKVSLSLSNLSAEEMMIVLEFSALMDRLQREGRVKSDTP